MGRCPIGVSGCQGDWTSRYRPDRDRERSSRCGGGGRGGHRRSHGKGWRLSKIRVRCCQSQQAAPGSSLRCSCGRRRYDQKHGRRRRGGVGGRGGEKDSTWKTKGIKRSGGLRHFGGGCWELTEGVVMAGARVLGGGGGVGRHGR